MNKLQHLVLFLSVVAYQAIPVTDLSAQQEAEGHSTHTCGSDWARHLQYSIVPEDYQDTDDNHTSHEEVPVVDRPVQISKSSTAEKFFIVRQDATGWETVSATPVYKGRDVIIWLADAYVNLVRKETINRLATGLEDRVKEGPATRNPNKGVITNDIEMFGQPSPDRWSKGKVKIHILLLKINSPISGGAVDGYFSPHDQTQSYGSNQRNLLYIDIRRLLLGTQEGVDRVLGTIAHEFQHLINYARYKGANDETHWIYNEGLSEVASIRNGYWSRSADNYLNAPNKFAYFTAPIVGTGADTLLRAYERAMLWTYYLSEQFGDRFLYELVTATGAGVEPARAAMRQSGYGTDVEGMVGSFWAANYLQGMSGVQAQYGYEFPISSIASGTVTHGTLPDIPENESITLREYAAYYPEYRNEQPYRNALRVRFFSGPNRYRAHAIIYRPNNIVEVEQISPDTEHVFSQFTNVVFSLADVSGSEQTIWWSAEKILPEAAGNDGEPSFTFLIPSDANEGKSADRGRYAITAVEVRKWIPMYGIEYQISEVEE